MFDKLTEKLQTLHKKTTEGSNYEEAATWFMMNLARLPELSKASQPSKGHPLLIKALETSLRAMHQNALKEKSSKGAAASKASSAELHLFHVPAHKFHHGSVKLKDGMGLTFYFEESRIGVLYLKFDFNPRIWVSRYSGIPMGKDDSLQYRNRDWNVN